jgi:peptide/nickel transport system permease protein
MGHAYWVSVYSGGAIFITVVGFNLFGDGLRDILDPKLRQ